MSTGLKDQLGLGEPKAAGSTAQADQFKAAFQAAAGEINAALQYTAAYAQKTKHDPEASKRDKSCEAYQIALGRIDPTNPAAAQGAIDQVLSGVNAVKSAVATLKVAVEKAYNAWTGKQSLFESITDKVTEMVEWGHTKAAALQQVIQAILAKANEKAWEEALKALDQLEGKFTALWEEYQKQKAAQAEYEPALQTLQPRLETIKACTYTKLADKIQAVTAAEGPMHEAASAKDYVKALELLKSLEQSAVPLEAEIAEIDAKKQQYEQARSDVDGQLSQASSSQYKSLADLDQQITDLTAQTDQLAADGDYDQALAKVDELKCKVEEKLTKVEELDAKRQQYEEARAEVDGKLSQLSTSEYKSLAELDQQIVDLTTKTDQAATDEDYDQAITLVGELSCKVDEKEQKVQELDAKRQAYEDARGPVDTKLNDVATCEYTVLADLDQEIDALIGETDLAAEAEEFDQALTLVQQLSAKVDEKVQKVAELDAKRAEYETASAAAVDKMTGCLVTARDYPALKADRDALQPKKDEMQAAADAQDYDKALALAQELDAKSTKYLADGAKEQEQYDKKGQEIGAALDDANYFTRDDVARDWAHKLSDEELKYLPTEVRNRMMAEMQDGVFSDDDKKAIDRMYEVRTLDPEFEKEEMKNRQKLIDAMRNDPEMAKARQDWPTLSMEDRVKLMEKVANYQVEAYGTKDIPGAPPLTVDTYTEDPDPDGSITMGTYDHATGKFNVNLHPSNPSLASFDRALDLATHEAGHRYQEHLSDRMSGVGPELKPGDPLYNQAVTFQLNDKYYPNDPWDVYSNQPMEAHSRITGQAIQDAQIGK